jgi:hypothetical protein
MAMRGAKKYLHFSGFLLQKARATARGMVYRASDDTDVR